MSENKLKINIIKTNTGQCFISDCHATSGYDFNYHRNQVDKLLFDGENPISTHALNWFMISKYPNKIQRLVTGKKDNWRYELKDESMQSPKLPLTIPYEEREEYGEDIINALYCCQYDTLPDELEDVDCELTLMCEVSNYKESPPFEYRAAKKHDFSDRVYTVTNENIKHSLIDQIILPPPLLANSPCSLSSKEVYDVTRQFIKDNINTKYATITSDYDFCFEVKKIIPLIAPQTVTYQNYFAKSKKERSKVQFATYKHKETTIFQMTHTQSNYNNYTPIHGFQAGSEYELKEMLDTFLNDLITVINQPLAQCPHCKGTGYKEE